MRSPRRMLAYEQAGVEHIMFHLIPYKPASIRKFEEALHIYHQLSDENKSEIGNLIGIDSHQWLYLSSKGKRKGEL